MLLFQRQCVLINHFFLRLTIFKDIKSSIVNKRFAWIKIILYQYCHKLDGFFQNYSSLSKVKVFTFMGIYSCSCLVLSITRQMIRLLALILNMRFKVKQTTKVESLRKADWWLACNPRISRWIPKFLCLFWMYKCIRKSFNAV